MFLENNNLNCFFFPIEMQLEGQVHMFHVYILLYIISIHQKCKYD